MYVYKVIFLRTGYEPDTFFTDVIFLLFLLTFPQLLTRFPAILGSRKFRKKVSVAKGGKCL